MVDAVDLVVSSPLKRCIATAHRAFDAAFDRGVPLLLLSELQEVRAPVRMSLSAAMVLTTRGGSSRL